MNVFFEAWNGIVPDINKYLYFKIQLPLVVLDAAINPRILNA